MNPKFRATADIISQLEMGGQRDGGQENVCVFLLFCDLFVFVFMFLLCSFKKWFSELFLLCFVCVVFLSVLFSWVGLTPKPLTSELIGGTLAGHVHGVMRGPTLADPLGFCTGGPGARQQLPPPGGDFCLLDVCLST